ncbi:transglycosylase domain-containing protein [Microbacterium sp. RD1]|uniref:transglycosylase domain-containing protein n=1 Tax=Microbacterium sp. RD1 TaxID=3457313 RepID=UPI003FA5573C
MPDQKRTTSGVLGGLAGLVGLSAVAGVLITATVTPAIAVSGAAASSAISIFDNMPSYLEIDEVMQPTELFTQNPDNGEWELFTQFFEQNRSVVTFDQVAPVMYDAVLSSEDPRFYQHGGVDLIGTTRALLSNAAGGVTQGGSSISQQYVKNVLIQRCEANATEEKNEDGTTKVTLDEAKQQCFLEATQSSGVEGYERKLQEMRYAIQLENEYSKNDILLAYLNIANFGGITYSVDAAAKRYFGVPASQLSVAQAATLAGVVQNPNIYRIDQPEREDNGAANGVVENRDILPALNRKLEAGEITEEQYVAAGDAYNVTKGRQLYVLGRLLEDGKITQEQYDAAVIEPITPNIQQPQTGCESTGAAAYFCQYAVSVIRNDKAFGETDADRERALKRGGLRVYLTMDRRVQLAAETAIAQYAPVTMPNTRYGATSVSVEAGTGKVLAIAQNTKFTEDRDLAIADPAYTSIVYAGDPVFGASNGFSAGSTFKIFTLVDWLEKGHSVNESVDGRSRIIKKFTNSCIGDVFNSTWKANNFGGGNGGVGTPMSFTSASLNSGFVAMAAELDLCDIGKVAARMGVYANSKVNEEGATVRTSPLNDTAEPLAINGPAQIIGPDAVSPMAMAGAFATVASGGIQCEPQVIDHVTDADGNELPKPERTCTPALTPEVAATAAYALQGVMNGGTGSGANPRDGVAVLGKTGSHELTQTWMVESSTKVATAVWAGNADGALNPFRNSYRGIQLSNIRYPIARAVQSVANDIYGGERSFPAPDNNLTRRVTKEVPNVVGQTIEQATATLENAGWEVIVGPPVDSDQATDIVAAQSPAGSAPGGTPVTISPSNGQAAPIPDVAGMPQNAARSTLLSAGFTNLLEACTPGGPEGPATATGTSPAAGSVVSRAAGITVSYSAKNC